MATLEHNPTDSAATTTERYRRAGEAGDVDAILAVLSEDVVLHSPITNRLAFHGREEMRDLLEAVFETMTEIRYFADIGDDRQRALFFRARVGRQPIEECMRTELNDQGLISEITIAIRPLPGLAALAAALGPKVIARRRGPLLAALAKLLMAPLAIVTRAGDRLVPHLM